MVRPNWTATIAAAAVLVLAVVASSGGVGAAARPLAASLGSGSGSGVALDRVVAVQLTAGTNSSAQPSNCTYGNNVGGVCPPTPPASATGH
ncbi:hypothetical protein BS78_01G049000 [Paspalum vaginatum]|nr:hypothetical protein BS78_01G049000 [Paspalum vaginatum]